MVGHHRRGVAAHPLALLLLPVGLDLPVRLVVALLDLGMGAWFKGRPVHLGVVGPGVLGDVLDGVGLGRLEGGVYLFAFADVGVHVLAGSDGTRVAGAPLEGVTDVHGEVDVVGGEGVALGLFGFVAGVDVVLVKFRVQLGRLVERGSKTGSGLDILGPLNQQLQVLPLLPAVSSLCDDKPKDILKRVDESKRGVLLILQQLQLQALSFQVDDPTDLIVLF